MLSSRISTAMQRVYYNDQLPSPKRGGSGQAQHSSPVERSSTITTSTAIRTMCLEVLEGSCSRTEPALVPKRGNSVRIEYPTSAEHSSTTAITTLSSSQAPEACLGCSDPLPPLIGKFVNSARNHSTPISHSSTTNITVSPSENFEACLSCSDPVTLAWQERLIAARQNVSHGKKCSLSFALKANNSESDSDCVIEDASLPPRTPQTSLLSEVLGNAPRHRRLCASPFSHKPAQALKKYRRIDFKSLPKASYSCACSTGLSTYFAPSHDTFYDSACHCDSEAETEEEPHTLPIDILGRRTWPTDLRPVMIGVLLPKDWVSAPPKVHYHEDDATDYSRAAPWSLFRARRVKNATREIEGLMRKEKVVGVTQVDWMGTCGVDGCEFRVW